MKKRVVAYCRVSTKSDDQENSYENQKSYFQREIRNNADYEFSGIYADKGITGTTLNKRPDFNRMLKDAGLKDPENENYTIVAKPKFDLIVTKNTSRFARNVSVDVILKALAKNKVYVHFLDLDKTTKNAGDITYIQIFSTFDERDSRDKSTKTSFGMIEGAKKGVILSNNKIHGYTYIQAENRLEKDEHAPDIKQMFEMYAGVHEEYEDEQIGAHRIAKILFDKGVKNKHGKPYKEYTIRGILENEVYYGMVARMKYNTGVVFDKHSYPVKTEEENQIRFMSDKVEPIISKELFDKVQNIRKERVQHAEQVGKKKSLHYGTSPYAQKIFCASCNMQYRSQTTKYYGERKVRYYCCVGKMENHFNAKKCTNPNVSEIFLNNELRSERYTEILAESFIAAQKFLVALKSDLLSAINDMSAAKKLARLKVEYAEYDKQIAVATKLLIKGGAVGENAERELDILNADAGKIKADIDALEKPKNERFLDLVRIDESINELNRRLNEIYEHEKIYDFDIDNDGNIEGTLVDDVDLWSVYDIDYSLPPKKEFSLKEVLKDIVSIKVTRSKNLIIEFKTLAEIKQLVNRHNELIMTERTTAIYEELKATVLDGKTIYRKLKPSEVDRDVYLSEKALIDKALNKKN